ncbi:MAG: toll/interleukin-1 receptor domain-containing protein [Desulfobacterales bacterium]|jgi:hypothetical protein|nr:toll/interleukin-1 receptor domain-containing protein [Desulfobacterales bacterium]
MKRFDVFISCRRADTLYLAHALGYALRLAGHDAFVDTGSIGGGELYPPGHQQSQFPRQRGAGAHRTQIRRQEAA